MRRRAAADRGGAAARPEGGSWRRPTRRLVALLLLLGLASGCARWFRYARPTQPRTFDPAVPCGPTRLLATYHAATHRAAGVHPPVVLFEPLALRREVLDQGAGGGLVPYLNYRGFPVWVVFAEAHEGLRAAALGRCYAQAVDAIAEVTKAPRLHVGGVSLGGQVAAHALEHLREGAPLGRVFFYAAGIDYAYPGSLLAARAPLAAACAACAPWLSGFLPPPDEDRPLAERLPGLATAQAPVLFVNGKIDGVAPSESVYPAYELYGSAAPGPVRKRLVLVARENFLPDLDHWGMLGGAEEDGFEILAGWLESD
jgi:pimeloyl-ACP methyl ester carboxylesterase